MATEKGTTLTDDQIELKDNERFQELSKKQDRTDDENKEVGDLKERHGKRMQKKIDKLNWQTKTAEETAQKEKDARLELEKEVEALKGRVEAPKPTIINETVDIGGEKFFNDKSLQSKVDAGEITLTEANSYRDRRFKAEVKEEIRTEQTTEQKNKELARTRQEDALSVIAKYPNFSKTLADGSNNPNFNPEEPLYKTAMQLYNEGIGLNAKGLSIAVKRAKQVLRMDDTHIDRSDDLNLSESGVNNRRKENEEPTLDDDEKRTAIQMYCRGDVTNPKTQRPYTESEAVQVALEAKKLRPKRR